MEESPVHSLSYERHEPGGRPTSEVRGWIAVLTCAVLLSVLVIVWVRMDDDNILSASPLAGFMMGVAAARIVRRHPVLAAAIGAIMIFILTFGLGLIDRLWHGHAAIGEINAMWVVLTGIIVTMMVAPAILAGAVTVWAEQRA